MSRSAGIAVVCFVLGGVAGWWLGTYIAPEDTRAPDAGSQTSFAHPTAVAATGPASATAAPEPRSEREPLASSGLLDLQRLLESAPVPETGATGTIEGRVVTPELQPVPGVTIQAVANRPPSPDDRPAPAADPEADLETRIRDVVHLHRWQAATRRETTTDAQGEYRLGGLADSPYQIRASCRGYDVVSVREGAWKSVRPGERLDFVARRSVLLPVAVLSPDGSPWPSCAIHIRSGESHRTAAWSHDAPEVALAPGTHDLQARAPEGLASKAVPVTVQAGVRPDRLILQLAPTVGVHGRVIVGDDEAPHALHVWLVPVKHGAVPGSLEVPGLGRHLEVSADRLFAYRFDGLEAGLHAIGVGRTREFADHVESVAIRAPQTEQDVRLPPPDPRHYVHVTVLGPPDEPLSGVSVSARAISPSFELSHSPASIPGRNRSVWIRHSPEIEDDPGPLRHFVFAQSPWHGSVEREYRPGDDAAVALQFVTPALLKVSLQGAPGLASDLRLDLALVRHPIGPMSLWAAGAEPDAQGCAVLGPVQPGLHDLVLDMETDEGLPIEIARATVPLQSGENHWSLPVPPLYDVHVEIEDGAGSELELRSKDTARWFVLSEQADPEGRLVFRHVPAGNYALGAMPTEQMSIRVPAGGVIHFAPEPVNAMLVLIHSPDGLLARAGFQAGDVVIGVDGKRFENLGQLIGLLTEGTRRRDPAKLMVVRNGQELTIPFHLRDMDNHAKAGGRMEPSRWP
ncbi:MAG: carboxypeptidase regulatory-like domain-containing protein [Planctomycetes bacterium]|nr:carboxypeptidase regulatory-like domain-containing protein [Planctomycetota bacterium]